MTVNKFLILLLPLGMPPWRGWKHLPPHTHYKPTRTE